MSYGSPGTENNMEMKKLNTNNEELWNSKTNNARNDISQICTKHKLYMLRLIYKKYTGNNSLPKTWVT